MRGKPDRKGWTGCSLNKELPANELLECRKTLGLMTELERRLLKTRTELSAKTSFVSIAGELAFVVLSLAALAILFGLLLRDALRRKEIAREAALVNRELAKSVTTLKDRASESRLLTSARDELQLCVTLGAGVPGGGDKPGPVTSGVVRFAVHDQSLETHCRNGIGME